MKNSNTENAIMDFLENTVKAMDKSTKCLAVFLYLAKAFDTVDHELFDRKTAKLWYSRKCFVMMKTTYQIESKQIVKTGIPKGTVLGPILFLINISSITKLNNFVGDIICYADDTVLIYKGPLWQEITNTAETYKKYHYD